MVVDLDVFRCRALEAHVHSQKDREVQDEDASRCAGRSRRIAVASSLALARQQGVSIGQLSLVSVGEVHVLITIAALMLAPLDVPDTAGLFATGAIALSFGRCNLVELAHASHRQDAWTRLPAEQFVSL